MSASSLASILNHLHEPGVLVLGDFMLDEYIHGVVERISPEAPVPIVLEKEVRTVPGGAGNVVRNLRSLGVPVFMAGIIGTDESGRVLTESFAAMGIDEEGMGLIETDDRPTTRKTRILAGQQQVVRLDRESGNEPSEAVRDRMFAFIESVMPKIRAVIISDYDKGLVRPQTIERIVKLSQKHNCFIAVDPQVTHFNFYQRVDVLTPNHHEAGRFLGRKLVDDADVVAGGREIVARLNASSLLITRGEKGMTLFEPGRETHIPTMAREVFDVTGAGDTVISVYTAAVAAGASNEDAARLSNLAAGLVVAQLGAATVTVDELRRALKAQ